MSASTTAWAGRTFSDRDPNDRNPVDILRENVESCDAHLADLMSAGGRFTDVAVRAARTVAPIPVAA